MKYVLTIVLALMAFPASAQTPSICPAGMPTTPYLGLCVPPVGYSMWQLPVNTNWLKIDAAISASGGKPSAPQYSLQVSNAGAATFGVAPNIVINTSLGFNLVTAVALAANGTLQISSAQAIATNMTIPSNVALEVKQGGGGFNIASGSTFTINGPITAGRYQIFSGAGIVSFATNSTIREIYPEWWGADPTGTNDSTTAWQSAANAASTVNESGGTISCPNAVYKISNTVTSFALNTQRGISILGPEGQINGISASCTLAWTGQAGGTIWHYMGGHYGNISGVVFEGNGRGLWMDTAQGTGASTTISSITRASNTVTATLGSTETWPSGTNLVLSGVSDSSYDGYFSVWYQTDSTHISWSQTGANSTSSGGSIQVPGGGGSTDTAETTIYHNTFYSNPSTGVSINSASISANILSVTLSAPQIIYPNQWIWITGASDPVYNAYWQVLTVTSPTTFTAKSVEVLSEASTTSGTFFASNAGVSIGSNILNQIGNSVTNLTFEKNQFEGFFPNGNGPWAQYAIEVDGNGNTKNFRSINNIFTYYRIAWMNPISGTFLSDGDHGVGIIDAIYASNVLSTMEIKNGEWEPIGNGDDHAYVFASMTSGSYNAGVQGPNGQFELMNNVNNNGSLSIHDNSFQLGQYATDGIAISTSAKLALKNDEFWEEYSTSPVPIINVLIRPGQTTGRMSIVSEHNMYANVPANTWAPIKTNGLNILGTNVNGLSQATSQYDYTLVGASLGNLQAYPLQSQVSTGYIKTQNLSTTQNAIIGTNLNVGNYLYSQLAGFGPDANQVIDSLFSGGGVTGWPIIGGAGETVTPNVGTDPFGGTTAEEVSITAGVNHYSQQEQTTSFTLLSGHTYAFTVFAKGGIGGEELNTALTAGGLCSTVFSVTTNLEPYTLTCTLVSNLTAVPYIIVGGNTSMPTTVYLSQAQLCEVNINCGSPLITTTAPLSFTGALLDGVPALLTGTTGTITGTSLSATCDSGTVSIMGANVGMPVIVSSTTGADVGGAFNVRGSVTSAGTVTVYICGTGIPASLAFNVVVL